MRSPPRAGLQDIELRRISQEVTKRFYNLLAVHCPRGGIARYSFRRKICLPPVTLTDVQISLPNCPRPLLHRKRKSIPNLCYVAEVPRGDGCSRLRLLASPAASPAAARAPRAADVREASEIEH